MKILLESFTYNPYIVTEISKIKTQEFVNALKKKGLQLKTEFKLKNKAVLSEEKFRLPDT